MTSPLPCKSQSNWLNRRTQHWFNQLPASARTMLHDRRVTRDPRSRAERFSSAATAGLVDAVATRRAPRQADGFVFARSGRLHADQKVARPTKRGAAWRACPIDFASIVGSVDTKTSSRSWPGTGRGEHRGPSVRQDGALPVLFRLHRENKRCSAEKRSLTRGEPGATTYLLRLLEPGACGPYSACRAARLRH